MPYNTNIPGHMSTQELAVIEQWAAQVPKNGVVVEVGSFFGRSAVCWAMSCDPSVEIICVDQFPTILQVPLSFKAHPGSPTPGVDYRLWDMFRDNTKEYPNITPVRGLSPWKISYPGNLIDLFFLDAAHTNPSDWDNIVYFSTFLKPGAIIAGHDYNSVFPDVVENVHRLENIYNTKATFYKGGWLWSITIPNTNKLTDHIITNK